MPKSQKPRKKQYYFQTIKKVVEVEVKEMSASGGRQFSANGKIRGTGKGFHTPKHTFKKEVEKKIKHNIPRGF